MKAPNSESEPGSPCRGGWRPRSLGARGCRSSLRKLASFTPRRAKRGGSVPRLPHDGETPHDGLAVRLEAVVVPARSDARRGRPVDLVFAGIHGRIDRHGDEPAVYV